MTVNAIRASTVREVLRDLSQLTRSLVIDALQEATAAKVSRSRQPALPVSTVPSMVQVSLLIATSANQATIAVVALPLQPLSSARRATSALKELKTI